MLFNSRKFFPRLAQSLINGKAIISPSMGAPAYSFSSLKDKKEKIAAKRTMEMNASAFTSNATPFSSDSAGAALKKDEGLRSFIQKCYKTTGYSIFGAFSAAQLAIITGIPLASPMVCCLGGLGASLAGIYFFNKAPVYMGTENINGVNYNTIESSQSRKNAYMAVIGGVGISMAPILSFFQLVNPMAILGAGMLTVSISAGASLYAYMRPKDSLLWLRGPLVGALGVLLVSNLAAIGSAALFGPSAFSALAHRFDLYAGSALFTALIAYDTHVAIKMYDEGVPDHLQVSLDFFLNFTGLFRRLLEIIGFSSND